MTIDELKRLGYRLPRKNLLPPYMSDPYFQEYAEIIDATYKSYVDAKVDILFGLRKLWQNTPEHEAVILSKQMVDINSEPKLERSILVKQVNALGMYLSAAASVQDENIQTMARFLGKYWWERGTYGFMEFINYCLRLDLEMRPLWAEVSDINDTRYMNMTLENPDGTPPGTPVWKGGTWYPTTHVSLVSYTDNIAMPYDDIGLFFYEIANYNLVLDGIEFIFYPIVVAEMEDIITEIVAHCVFMEQHAFAELRIP